MSDENKQKKIPMSIPIWVAFTFIVGMFISGGSTVISAITSKGNSDHAVIYEKLLNEERLLETTKISIDVQEKRLSDVEKAIVLLTANQNWVMAKIRKD